MLETVGAPAGAGVIGSVMGRVLDEKSIIGPGPAADGPVRVALMKHAASPRRPRVRRPAGAAAQPPTAWSPDSQVAGAAGTHSSTARSGLTSRRLPSPWTGIPRRGTWTAPRGWTSASGLGQSRAVFNFTPFAASRSAISRLVIDGRPLSPQSDADVRIVAVPGTRQPFIEIQLPLDPAQPHTLTIDYRLAVPAVVSAVLERGERPSRAGQRGGLADAQHAARTGPARPDLPRARPPGVPVRRVWPEPLQRERRRAAMGARHAAGRVVLLGHVRAAAGRGHGIPRVADRRRARAGGGLSDRQSDGGEEPGWRAGCPSCAGGSGRSRRCTASASSSSTTPAAAWSTTAARSPRSARCATRSCTATSAAASSPRTYPDSWYDEAVTVLVRGNRARPGPHGARRILQGQLGRRPLTGLGRVQHAGVLRRRVHHAGHRRPPRRHRPDDGVPAIRGGTLLVRAVHDASTSSDS